MFGLPKAGTGFAFARIARHAAENGIDLAALGEKSLLVVGSKGKGSVAALIAGGLGGALAGPLDGPPKGRGRVGLFTSPHLRDVTERFALDGAPMPRADFDRLIGKVLEFNAKLAGEGETIGGFEALFLVALEWFRETQPDAIVWEAGIGGRYDPTRMIGARFGALTSVELEHTEYLGTSPEAIACDKLDGFAAGAEIAISPSVDAALAGRIAAWCALTGKTPAFVAERYAAGDVSVRQDGTRFALAQADAQPLPVTLAMPGAHQVANALTAFAAARAFLAARDVAADTAALLDGIAAARLPGRLEKVSHTPPVWIDIGHTPGSVAAAADWLDAAIGADRLLVVLGVSRGKAADIIVPAVAARFDAILAACAFRNGRPAAEIAALVPAERLRGAAETSAAAVAAALEIARREGRGIAVLGSLYLAVEFDAVLKGNDPHGFEFF